MRLYNGTKLQVSSTGTLPGGLSAATDYYWIWLTPSTGKLATSLANARAEPRVALLLDAYDDDWSRLWWLRIDGEARVVEGAEPAAEAALRAKYPQYATTPLFAAGPCWLRIAPLRTTSWSASPAAARVLSSSRAPAPTRDSRG